VKRSEFVERITSLVPSAENLRESAQWAVVLQNVKGLDAMAAAMDLTQLNEEVEQKRQQVEALKEEVGSLANLSQEERVRAEAALALEMERQNIELHDLEKRLEIERSIKEQMEKENAEARQREIGDVLKGMSAKLRNILAEAAEHVASAIRKKEQVDERHVTQLRTAVEKIATLNFTGDQDIQALAAEVEKLTRTVPSHRDPARFREVLGNISAVVRADLALLGCDGAVTPSTEGLVEKAWKARAKLGMVDAESADAMSAAAPTVRRRRASAEPASAEEQVTPQPKGRGRSRK
jgi:uncharacterized phage infection (PIP) family protein YhgE